MSDTNTSIQIFNNEDFGEVRTLIINDEPWFVGKDVAEILGYAKPRNAIASHVDEEDKKDAPIQGDLGGTQTMTIINESGLYSLILSSKLPTAKQFKRWVTSEVLPAIRKNGSYSIERKPDSYMIEDPIQRAQRWIEEETERQQMRDKIEADKPLVEFADHVSNTTTLIDVGELAKIAKKEHINIGRTRLFEWLRSNDYLMNSVGHKNQPYQKYIEQGLFKLREYTYTTPYGEQTGLKTYVTGKGQIYFIEKLRKIFGNKSDNQKPQEVLV